MDHPPADPANNQADSQAKNQADPAAILKKRQMPALVVLDTAMQVTWLNREAAMLLGTPTLGGTSDAALPDAPLSDAPLMDPTPIAIAVREIAADLMAEMPDAHAMASQPMVATCRDGERIFGLRADYMVPTPGPDAVATADRPSRSMIAVYIDTVSLAREVDFDAVRRRYNITRREQEVLRMMYFGKSNRQIAEVLFLSEYTVKDHIKSIMAKMDAESRAQAVYKLTIT